MGEIAAFMKDLEASIQKKHLLNHVFYKAWSEGRLSIDCLRDYAQEYYHHVKAFPTYLSALHSHTEDAQTRLSILNNLIDEEGGFPNHPELWRQFTLSLGVKPEQLEAHAPCKEIKILISTFQAICHEHSISKGLAALYAYESQIPAISRSKIEGLKTHYQKDASSYRYFSVHIEADEEHSRVERELLCKHVQGVQSDEALMAAGQVLDALWNFLSYLSEKHHIQCL